MFFNPETIREDITFDGRTYRFDYQKRGDQNIQVKGSEKIASDGKYYWWVTVINYNAGAEEKKVVIRSWDDKRLCPLIRNELSSHVSNKKSSKEVLRLKQKALRLARIIYSKSKPLTYHHEYLQAKGLSPLGNERISGRKLVFPIINTRGEIVNVQTVGPDTRKKNLKNCEIIGHFMANLDLVKKANVIGVCEGWATKRTLELIYKFPIVSALNANNITHVCRSLLKVCKKDARFVIFADDDSKEGKTQNAGIDCALNAHEILVEQGRSSTVIAPIFKNKGANSDFNDLYVAEGPDALKTSFRVVGKWTSTRES